jgi:Family of unknown function (DUF5670)
MPQPADDKLHEPFWNRGIESRRFNNVLWTICVILLQLWALGLATAYTAGGLIHILPVIVIFMLLVRLFRRRRLFPQPEDAIGKTRRNAA